MPPFFFLAAESFLAVLFRFRPVPFVLAVGPFFIPTEVATFEAARVGVADAVRTRLLVLFAFPEVPAETVDIKVGEEIEGDITCIGDPATLRPRPAPGPDAGLG